MDRFNPAATYHLGRALSELRAECQKGTVRGDARYVAIEAHHVLNRLVSSGLLMASAGAARELMDSIALAVDPDRDAEPGDTVDIEAAADAFEVLALEEFGRMPAFMVDREGIYRTEVLIGKGDSLMPDSVRSALNPEERLDFTLGARCLAFHLPTAGAFHLFRSLERVVRRFCATTAGLPSTNKARPGLGDYADSIGRGLTGQAERPWKWAALNDRQTRAARVAVMVIDLAQAHRNPVVHPEQDLSIEEADRVLHLIAHAITMLVTEMGERAFSAPVALATP